MIYFAVALKEEIAEFPFEKFLGEDYKIIYTGVGKTNATLHLADAIRTQKPDLVINIGTAGTPKHKLWDVLICNHFKDGDLTEIQSVKNDIKVNLPSKYANIFNPKYCVTTCDTFSNYVNPVTSDAADMESFSLASVCDFYEVPFVAIKIITDIIGNTSVIKWEEQLPAARKLAVETLVALNK